MAEVRGSASRAAGTQAQFVQGFLAAVRSMAKDCIPPPAAAEVLPGALCRVLRPVYELVGTCALLLAQARGLEQVNRQKEA